MFRERAAYSCDLAYQTQESGCPCGIASDARPCSAAKSKRQGRRADAGQGSTRALIERDKGNKICSMFSFAKAPIAGEPSLDMANRH